MNGDGNMDVIAYSSNSHLDADNNLVSEDLPITLYLFNEDETFVKSSIGDKYSFHGGASGDVDNAGDVDVLSWGSKSPFPTNYIGILKNNGNGSFQFDSNAIQVNNPIITNSAQSLVDLNNDGCLDIIAGCFFMRIMFNPNS